LGRSSNALWLRPEAAAEPIDAERATFLLKAAASDRGRGRKLPCGDAPDESHCRRLASPDSEFCVAYRDLSGGGDLSRVALHATVHRLKNDECSAPQAVANRLFMALRKFHNPPYRPSHRTMSSIHLSMRTINQLG
jgi:hypothetical protein